MFYLFLAIACSVLLGFLFKLFDRYKIPLFQAIMFNYFTCVACGWLHSGELPYTAADRQAAWMPYALVLGLVFIAGFNTAALTVRFFGVTISQIMQKMSILATVPFAILVFRESAGALKLFGIVMALAAIILVNWPSSNPAAKDKGVKGPALWWIPLMTWVLASVLEILLVLVNKGQLTEPGDPAFITTVFCTAGLLGLLVAVAGWATGRMSFSWRTVLAGIVLGVPNYGSMLFLLMALDSGLEASHAFPLINVGIIVFTTIGAILLFHERIGKANWWGVALAVAAIVLISA